MRNRLMVFLSGLLLIVSAASAPGSLAAEARPTADEDCVRQCDEQSDKCMTEAGGDEDKAKACDDQYAECLQKCR